MTLARLRTLVVVTAIALACVGCGTAATPPAAGTPPPAAPAAAIAAPEWRVGDRWVYEWTSGTENGTKTVEIVAAGDIKGVPYYVARLGDAEVYYTRALHWAFATREGKVEARMVPPTPWFMWPLATGARWTHEGRFEQRDSTATHVDRFVVVGPEAVDVPAGKYETLKVRRETDRRDSDEYWYAADVRWYARWVGRRGDTQFEERLREYHAAPRQR